MPGRTEYMERYAEVIADFLEKGFAVAILDMRNHGLSDRPLANRQAHFVADFAPMADDVARFVAQGAALDLPRPFTLLGHSMGGHVALRAVHDHPQLARSVDKLVLCAPMLRIRFSPLPLWLVRGLVALAGALGFWERYALGQGDWAGGKARARLMRLLTSDAQRFAVEDWQVAQNPDLKLGGVTWGWLRAALNSCDLLAQKAMPKRSRCRRALSSPEAIGWWITTPAAPLPPACPMRMWLNCQTAAMNHARGGCDPGRVFQGR
ncbi:alpha/beta fold hydrolase [Iodidimonas gelatinilytica]|uniref:alpha/beta fold hydrolase n=1 Tax=Iodidimonas gelatinilytica TaxID=1236966 RepID=UPI001F4790B7|nr:alpha/beta hydrolase [Iodidimonas gelatinilytica]